MHINTLYFLFLMPIIFIYLKLTNNRKYNKYNKCEEYEEYENLL